jgi:release factor glutamine methyltransferase
MTIKELYSYCSDELSFTECGDFETLCIFNDILGFSKENILLNFRGVTDSHKEIIDNIISRRKNGEPLQYILGKWDFYDLTFLVGKGVLIPRPETEILVDFALEKIESIESPVVFDLCAGTGCIGLTIAKHRKDATVYLFEKEDKAFSYLQKNREKYGLENAILVKTDILNDDISDLPKCDILLSNPPYIESDEIKTLQKEVHFEPYSALDGGKDGLIFYRAICDRWIEKVNKNGYLAFECGEEQSEQIIQLFSNKHTENHVIFDFNNIDRVVTFRI